LRSLDKKASTLYISCANDGIVTAKANKNKYAFLFVITYYLYSYFFVIDKYNVNGNYLLPPRAPPPPKLLLEPLPVLNEEREVERVVLGELYERLLLEFVYVRVLVEELLPERVEVEEFLDVLEFLVDNELRPLFPKLLDVEVVDWYLVDEDDDPTLPRLPP
jgi:hypothetical protein